MDGRGRVPSLLPVVGVRLYGSRCRRDSEADAFRPWYAAADRVRRWPVPTGAVVAYGSTEVDWDLPVRCEVW